MLSMSNTNLNCSPQDQRGWLETVRIFWSNCHNWACTPKLDWACARRTWNGHILKPVLPQRHNMLVLECAELNMWLLHTSHCEHLCKFPQMKMPRQKCQFLTSGPIRKDPRSVKFQLSVCWSSGAPLGVTLHWPLSTRVSISLCGNWELFKYQDLLMICYDWACAGAGFAFQNFYPSPSAPQRRYLQDSIT